MRCKCGNEATGTLITWYHDGYGMLDCEPMCMNCGGNAHDPFTHDDDPAVRRKAFIVGPVTKSETVMYHWTFFHDIRHELEGNNNDYTGY